MEAAFSALERRIDNAVTITASFCMSIPLFS
jgi:hypothetical protein